jgi:hypothetical protein
LDEAAPLCGVLAPFELFPSFQWDFPIRNSRWASRAGLIPSGRSRRSRASNYRSACNQIIGPSQCIGQTHCTQLHKQPPPAAAPSAKPHECSRVTAEMIAVPLAVSTATLELTMEPMIATHLRLGGRAVVDWLSGWATEGWVVEACSRCSRPLHGTTGASGCMQHPSPNAHGCGSQRHVRLDAPHLRQRDRGVQVFGVGGLGEPSQSHTPSQPQGPCQSHACVHVEVLAHGYAARRPPSRARRC